MSWELIGLLITLPIWATFFAVFVMINALVEPWIDVSSTNPSSFIFPTLIIGTLAAITIRHVIKPYSDRWLCFAKRLLFFVNLSAPLIYLGAIYFLSFRGWQVLGHEPRYMLDDPKNICPNDVTYQMIYSAVDFAYAGSGWLLYTSFGLIAHLWRRLTLSEAKWYLITLITGWVLLALTDRYSWWLD